MKYKSPQGLDRPTLLKHLIEGICQVTFTKVKDNTSRSIYCTLEKGLLPAKYEESVNKVLSEAVPNQDLIPIWDVAEGKWKSFKLSRLTIFVTSDELIKENVKAHGKKLSIKEQTELLKSKIVKEFNERVERLKQQALDARNNINGESNESEA